MIPKLEKPYSENLRATLGAEGRYLHGKNIYKHQQLELTIPAKFKDIVEPFMYTDLKIEARREGNNLIIEAKPVEPAG